MAPCSRCLMIFSAAREQEKQWQTCRCVKMCCTSTSGRRRGHDLAGKLKLLSFYILPNRTKELLGLGVAHIHFDVVNEDLVGTEMESNQMCIYARQPGGLSKRNWDNQRRLPGNERAKIVSLSSSCAFMSMRCSDACINSITMNAKTVTRTK